MPLGLLGAVLGLLSAGAGLVAAAAGRLAVRAWPCVLAEGFRRTAPVLAVWSPNGFETLALTLARAAGGWPPSAASAGAAGCWLLAAVGLALGGGGLVGRHLQRLWTRACGSRSWTSGRGTRSWSRGRAGSWRWWTAAAALDGRFDPGSPGDRAGAAAQDHRADRSGGAVAPAPRSHEWPAAMLRAVPGRRAVDHGDGGGNPAYDRLLALAGQRGVPRPAPARLAGARPDHRAAGALAGRPHRGAARAGA